MKSKHFDVDAVNLDKKSKYFYVPVDAVYISSCIYKLDY